MKFAHPLFFFFLLSAAKGQSETETVEDSQKKIQFHTDEHNETREFLRFVLDGYFSNLMRTNSEILLKLESLNEKIFRIERNLEVLSANFSIASNMENLHQNLSNSFSQGLSQSDLKTETSLFNLSQTFTQKLLKTELKLEKALGDLSELEVEEVNFEEGTIQFAARSNSQLRRKVWVLQSEGGSSYSSMSFILEENNLRTNGFLYLWGSGYPKGHQQVWNGYQGNSWMERESEGNVILVTLIILPGAAEQPSFKLRFNTTSTGTRTVCSSELVHKEGRQVVSFPPNNTENYPPESLFVAVIARPGGEPFGLNLKYLDAPGESPDSCLNWFDVYFPTKDIHTAEHYTRLSPFAYTRCGRVGAISESLGNYTFAILRFSTFGGSDVGKGFRVEVN